LRVSRGVAQHGSASALGAEGREFESLRPDHSSLLNSDEDAIEGFAPFECCTYVADEAVRKQHSQQFGLFDQIRRNI
jgi:hypothetical protein